MRQVWSHDTYGRNALAGYGFCHIPTMPGTYALDVHCWRPKPQSWLEYLSGFFLGAYAQLRNPDLVWRQDDRYRLSTVATGTVRLEVRAPRSLLAARLRAVPAHSRPGGARGPCALGSRQRPPASAGFCHHVRVRKVRRAAVRRPECLRRAHVAWPRMASELRSWRDIAEAQAACAWAGRAGGRATAVPAPMKFNQPHLLLISPQHSRGLPRARLHPAHTCSPHFRGGEGEGERERGIGGVPAR